MFSLMRWTTSLSTSDARRKLDKEIAVREAAHAANEIALRDLRARRNAYSPVYKLPDEVLSDIFILAMAAPLTDGETSAYTYPRDGRGWLNVVSVCRDWREIALNTPLIWNTFDVAQIGSVDWALARMERSKNTPLSVNARYLNVEHQRTVMETIFSNFTQIQDLKYVSTNTRFLEVMEVIITSTTLPTRARTLNIRSLPTDWSPTGGPIDTSTMMQRFFGIQMPFLRSLTLGFLALPSALPPLPQLRHLCLASRIGFMFQSMSMATLLSCLTCTPSLEELEIDDILAQPAEGTEHQTVNLPNLSRISLRTSFFSNSSLFRHIRYPSSSQVRFVERVYLGVQNEDIDILATITSLFAGSDAVTNIDMISLRHDTTWLDLQAYTGEDTAFRITCNLTPQATLQFVKLWATLLSSDVWVLHVSGFAAILDTDWADILRPYEHVLELSAERVGPNFIRGLSKSFDDKPAPLPQLEHLYLYHCFFDGTAPRPSLTLSVELFLEERMSPEIPFERLWIHQSSVVKATIDRLGEYTKLSWDASIHDTEENKWNQADVYYRGDGDSDWEEHDKQDNLFMRDMVAADLMGRVYSD